MFQLQQYFFVAGRCLDLVASRNRGDVFPCPTAAPLLIKFSEVSACVCVCVCVCVLAMMATGNGEPPASSTATSVTRGGGRGWSAWPRHVPILTAISSVLSTMVMTDLHIFAPQRTLLLLVAMSISVFDAVFRLCF